MFKNSIVVVLILVLKNYAKLSEKYAMKGTQKIVKMKRISLYFEKK